MAFYNNWIKYVRCEMWCEIVTKCKFDKLECKERSTCTKIVPINVGQVNSH